MISKQLKAFLDLIAWSEGTDDGRQKTNDHGYDVIVGGELFSGYKDHPRVKVWLEKLKVYSTAAGRYQVLARYFDVYKKQLLLNDFSPACQDLIAIQMIKECGAINDIETGDIRAALKKCKSRWASLPAAGYGQHEHSEQTLIAKFISLGGKLKG